MKSLVPPSGNHFTEFSGLTVTRPALGLLANEIKDRYSAYQATKQQLEVVPTVSRTQAEKDEFKSAYTTVRRRLNRKMSEGIAEVELCPYCLIEYARDWDHFLSQTKFPDFAVYRPNLIRSCTSCNRNKGDRLVALPRKTLNPYFDGIDTVLFLKCEVDTTRPLTAIFGVDPPIGTNPYFSNLIREHFEAYDLARKYRAHATDKLTKFIRDVRYEVRHGAPLSQTLINKEVKKITTAPNLTCNYWLLALAQGLKSAPDLLYYLQHQIGAAGASDVA